jgi:hypothetical protein
MASSSPAITSLPLELHLSYLVGLICKIKQALYQRKAVKLFVTWSTLNRTTFLRNVTFSYLTNSTPWKLVQSMIIYHALDINNHPPWAPVAVDFVASGCFAVLCFFA